MKMTIHRRVKQRGSFRDRYGKPNKLVIAPYSLIVHTVRADNSCGIY